jgi:hypothetical protein
MKRIWNGTVVQEKLSEFSREHKPLKGVVISQTDNPDYVIVRWEGGSMGEWAENTHQLVVLNEKPVQDGTRAYSGVEGETIESGHETEVEQILAEIGESG